MPNDPRVYLSTGVDQLDRRVGAEDDDPFGEGNSNVSERSVRDLELIRTFSYSKRESRPPSDDDSEWYRAERYGDDDG